MGSQQHILYTVAAIIVAFVFFILFGVQERTGDAAVEAIRYRAAKQDMLNLVQMIEHDFRNMGAYLYKTPSGAFVGKTMDMTDILPIDWYDSTDVAGPGKRYEFKFLAQTDSMAAPPPTPTADLVKYVWEPTGETVTLQDGTVRPLYRVERFVNGTLTGFANTVTEMNLEATKGNGQTITNRKEVRIIHLSLTGISSLGKGAVVEETHFDAVYRPVPLTIPANLQKSTN